MKHPAREVTVSLQMLTRRLLGTWWSITNIVDATSPDLDASWADDGEAELEAFALVARRYPAVAMKWANHVKNVIGHVTLAGQCIDEADQRPAMVLQMAAGTDPRRWPAAPD